MFSVSDKEGRSKCRRLQQHLDEMNDDSVIINHSIHDRNGALFSVIKDRHSVYATVENLVQESENRVWMMLSKWGILHGAVWSNGFD